MSSAKCFTRSNYDPFRPAFFFSSNAGIINFRVALYELETANMYFIENFIFHVFNFSLSFVSGKCIIRQQTLMLPCAEQGKYCCNNFGSCLVCFSYYICLLLILYINNAMSTLCIRLPLILHINNAQR